MRIIWSRKYARDFGVKQTRQSPHKNIIGNRVREARLKMSPKVSQEDLSGKLAVLGIQITQTSLSKIEGRTRYVMDYEAAALAKALKVTVAWLYGEDSLLNPRKAGDRHSIHAPEEKTSRV